MKIVYCGDVVGRAGRDAVLHNLPLMREKYKADVIIVNVENAAHGFGVTPGIAREFLERGADLLTTGNHVWQQRDIIPFLDENKRIIRPLNYPDSAPGRGFAEFELLNGKKILIDCGLQQGKDEHDGNTLDFAPNYIDYVLITHAHIDHSGRLPLLVKEGFNGRILTTGLTAQLLSVMLRDSAHIQEGDANWHNQKGKRAGLPPVEPLYTLMDAEEAIQMLETVEYGWLFDLCEGVKVRFTDAGHLLGSSCVEIWATENGVTKKIVFSGDLGNEAQPIIRDPSFVDEADYVVMESTYGDRNHEPPESYAGALADLIDEVFAKGGNIVIPSFAVGRTQELLYYLREIKRDGLVQSLPSFKVYVDSPLASEATKIYSGNLKGYLDDDAIAVIQGGENLFTFPGLTLTQSTEESRALNDDKTPKIIISASGMCDAGRIRHHLKHNLW